jgi:hypothetical protein
MSTVALSDQPFVTEARQTAWVLDSGGERLTGGEYINVVTVGEALAWNRLQGNNKLMHPGFIPKWKFTVPPTTGAAEAEAPVVASRLVGNWPNPFNPATSIRFDLAQEGPVTLRIFDISGRLVRSLAVEHLSAGQHSVDWDGRNGSGGQAASGVYILEMVSGDYRGRHKMVLAR